MKKNVPLVITPEDMRGEMRINPQLRLGPGFARPGSRLNFEHPPENDFQSMVRGSTSIITHHYTSIFTSEATQRYGTLFLNLFPVLTCKVVWSESPWLRTQTTMVKHLK